MLPFICCQSQGKTAFGNTQLTVDLEPYLCSGIVQRCFQSADRGQRKIRNIGIQYHIPIVVARAVDAHLNTGNAERFRFYCCNTCRELTQQHQHCQHKAYPVAYIPLFFVPYQHKQLLLAGKNAIKILF